MQLLLHQLIGKVWTETQYLHKISGHFHDKTPRISYSRTYFRPGKNFWTFPRLLEFPGRVDTLSRHSRQKQNLNFQVWLLLHWNLFFQTFFSVWFKYSLRVHCAISTHFNEKFWSVFKGRRVKRNTGK